jgi:hypothetical protein
MLDSRPVNFNPCNPCREAGNEFVSVILDYRREDVNGWQQSVRCGCWNSETIYGREVTYWRKFGVILSNSLDSVHLDFNFLNLARKKKSRLPDPVEVLQ